MTLSLSRPWNRGLQRARLWHTSAAPLFFHYLGKSKIVCCQMQIQVHTFSVILFLLKNRTCFFSCHTAQKTQFCPWGQRGRLLVWMVASLALASLRTSTQNPGANRKMTPLIISMSNPVYSAEEANYVDRTLRAAPGWLQQAANTKLMHAWLNVGLVETSIIENFKFKNRRLWFWQMQTERNKRSNIALLTCFDQFKCVLSTTFPHFYHLRYHRMK